MCVNCGNILLKNENRLLSNQYMYKILQFLLLYIKERNVPWAEISDTK
jgi:hypothetical protein